MSLFGKGIGSSNAKRFAHSTSTAGITCELKTLVSVPAAWAYMSSANATTNYGNNAEFRVGESNAATDINRGWALPTFASIPNGSKLVTYNLNLYVKTDLSSNARTMRVHRCLQNVVYNQCTWNVYSTGNSWGTAGASGSGVDYDATEMGSISIAASPAYNTEYSIPLDVTEVVKMYDGTYTNYGFVVFVDTQVSDLIVYHGTAAPEGAGIRVKFYAEYY